MPGWFGIDRKAPEPWRDSEEGRFIDLDVRRGLPFSTNQVDVAFSSHFLQHFTREEGNLLLYEIYRVLRPGAPFCISVPDMDLYLENYLKRNHEFLTNPEIIGGEPRDNLTDNFLTSFYSDSRFNNTCHKYAYNFENLSSILRSIGFEEIERVPSHDFSYFPELRRPEFRNLRSGSENVSLSVQCRKLSFDPHYRKRPEFKQCLTFARLYETEQVLSQQLNATLLINEGLHCDLRTSTQESEKTKLDLLHLNEDLQKVEAEKQKLATRAGELDAKTAELQIQAADLQQRLSVERAEHARLNLEAERLRTELVHQSEIAVTASSKVGALTIHMKQQAEDQVLRLVEANQANELTLKALETAALQARLNLKQAETLGRRKSLSDRVRSFRSRSSEKRAQSLSVEWLKRQLSKHAAFQELTKEKRLHIREVISGSSLFDADWYLLENPDVAASDKDPLDHYIEVGAFQGLDPNRLFRSDWYFTGDPEAETAGYNPLAHYIEFGAAEGRDPHPLFITSWYLSKIADRTEALGNPLRYFLQTHNRVCLDPHPLFDRSWYQGKYGAIAGVDAFPFAHYVQLGDLEGLDPNPLFDTFWYGTRYPDILGVESFLAHFMRHGADEGRNPNAYFDTAWYLAENPDVAAANLNPLLHYIGIGAEQGRDPGPLFSTRGYLTNNPDVETSGLNPLAHFLQYGAAEGRDPNPKIILRREQPLDPAGLGHVTDPHLRTVLARSATERGVGQYSETRYSPLISILIPTYNTPVRYLKEVLQSVQKQTYTNWELCIVDDGSSSADCLRVLRELEISQPQIKITFSQSNEGIAKSSQRALDLASGEFVGFVDHDDVLASNALAEIVNLLRRDPTLDMIYTDHAMMDDVGVICSAALKPGWSPEFFFSTNYLVHLKVIRRSSVVEVGGFSGTVHVAQDIGLSCKLLESDAKVEHLPKVLYYWRMHSASVACGTLAKPAIEAAAMDTYNRSLERRGVKAILHWPDYFKEKRIGAYKLDFRSSEKRNVAVIIPALSGDVADVNPNEYLTGSDSRHRVEIHLVTSDPSMLAIDRQLRTHLAQDQSAFDEVIRQIDCDLLVFASPGGWPLSSGWLDELIGYLCLSPRIGAVGGKVLDDTLSVRAGGYVFVDNLATICAGQSDQSDGCWFNGRIASNVEAVSSRLMATTKAAYFEANGVQFFEYGDAAGIAYGCELRRAGYRVVYNPWSKIVDPRVESMPVNTMKLLLSKFGKTVMEDRYHHPFFSRETPCVLE